MIFLLTVSLAMAQDAREWFREARFGMFIHWGVYSLLGKGEWVMENDRMTVADYEKLPPRFDPADYEPAEWVRIAKDAGMRYITITSKHHDGFAMWDSKVSDYDIVDRTPYGKDVLKALAEECRKAGLKLFFYHSHLDWHHPDYYPRGKTGRHTGRPEAGSPGPAPSGFGRSGTRGNVDRPAGASTARPFGKTEKASQSAEGNEGACAAVPETVVLHGTPQRAALSLSCPEEGRQ